jgi:Ni,Fe-hydrogenase III small subunit
MKKLFPGSFKKTHKWYRYVFPKEAAISSDGSEFCIYLKKGTNGKLIVLFSGGGASWNTETAGKSLTIGRLLSGKDAYYFPKPSIIQELMMGGILASNSKKNPFNDWNFAVISYTTGDFHVGNTKFDYTNEKDEKKIMYHYGARNVAASLKVIYELFPDPKQLVIMGESAGAFGCVAQAASVTEMYPECSNITVVPDSGQLYFNGWKETVRDVWKANSEFWECIKTDNLLLDWFRLLYSKLGERVKYLNYCSYHDRTLTPYQNKMNHNRYNITKAALDEFYTYLVQTHKTLLKEIPNYYCYTSALNKKKKDDSTVHTAFRFLWVYTKNEQGISIADWLNDAINNNKFYNVGMELLELQK